MTATLTKNKKQQAKGRRQGGTLDPDVQLYIDGVLDDSIITCRYVKLAVQRHVRDLKDGHKRGLYFDEAAGQHIIDFFRFCRHFEGKWAGQTIELEPWQKFRLACIFGWKKADGTRRFDTAYNEVARKNGKSTEAAGIGLYGLVADNEPGAQIYTTATKMDQAKIIFRAAVKMVEKSPQLQEILEIYINNIAYNATDSFFRPLGADAKTLDGLNPHLSIADELHEYRDSSIWDIIETAIGSRRQPLMYGITTAGYNKTCFCYNKREYAINVLEGHIEDDSFFAIIYTLDEGDDWKDEGVWVKANPNLGVSVDLKKMGVACERAKNDPTNINKFLVKRLNKWTSQYSKYFNMEQWDRCIEQIGIELLKGRKCWMGTDLASTQDLASLVFLFIEQNEDGKNKLIIVPKYYCPMENAVKRSKRDNVNYLAWAEQGYLTLTPGNEIDYEFIQHDIEQGFKDYDVVKMGFDKWNFGKLRQDLVKVGVPEDKMIEVPQTLAVLNSPTKELHSAVNAGRVVHNGHPILRWNADNTAVYIDPNENVRPHKGKSSEKIDGIMATLNAITLYLGQPEHPDLDANLREVGI